MSRKHLDFEVDKEEWSIYSLQDGTKIKIRFMLESVTNEGRQKEMKTDVKIVCLCDESVRGEPTQEKYTQEQLRQSIEIEHCKYTTLNYEPSEYILDDNTRVVVHHNVLSIARTYLFDQEGDRIYNVNVTASLTTEVPRN